MISNHPYHTWPLHVKLLTDEAVKGWQDATWDVAMLPLPLGFTCSVELEGIDGKSGNVGTGRHGPIDVKDGNVIRPRTLLTSLTCSMTRTIYVCTSSKEYVTVSYSPSAQMYSL